MSLKDILDNWLPWRLWRRYKELAEDLDRLEAEVERLKDKSDKLIFVVKGNAEMHRNITQQLFDLCREYEMTEPEPTT